RQARKHDDQPRPAGQPPDHAPEGPKPPPRTGRGEQGEAQQRQNQSDIDEEHALSPADSKALSPPFPPISFDPQPPGTLPAAPSFRRGRSATMKYAADVYVNRPPRA